MLHITLNYNEKTSCWIQTKSLFDEVKINLCNMSQSIILIHIIQMVQNSTPLYHYQNMYSRYKIIVMKHLDNATQFNKILLGIYFKKLAFVFNVYIV